MSEIRDLSGEPYKSHREHHAAKERLEAAAPELLAMLHCLTDGFDYTPGHSDLDDEQVEHLRITLGDYRRALRFIAKAEGRT